MGCPVFFGPFRPWVYFRTETGPVVWCLDRTGASCVAPRAWGCEPRCFVLPFGEGTSVTECTRKGSNEGPYGYAIQVVDSREVVAVPVRQ